MKHRLENHSFVFNPFASKVDEVTNLSSRATKFIQQLSFVNGLIFRVAFQFDNDLVYNQQISCVIANNNTFKLNLEFWFQLNPNATQLQFHLQCALIHLFQKTKPENIMHFKRRANKLAGYRLKREILLFGSYLCFICVHLWLKDE